MCILDPPRFYPWVSMFCTFELLLSCDLNWFLVSPSAFLFCHICGRANSTWTYYSPIPARVTFVLFKAFHSAATDKESYFILLSPLSYQLIGNQSPSHLICSLVGITGSVNVTRWDYSDSENDPAPLPWLCAKERWSHWVHINLKGCMGSMNTELSVFSGGQVLVCMPCTDTICMTSRWYQQIPWNHSG